MAGRGTHQEGADALSGTDGTGMKSDNRRVALVIGNGAYSHAAALDNPVRDAQAMAGVLGRLGFDVVTGIDLDLRRLGDVQSAFEDRLRSKPDVALLFYAGHGLQVEGRNYLLPIDAEITAKSHLATRALLFNDVLDDMARDAAASLIFLDACRDNPFTRNLARSMGDSARYAGVRGGLARIEKVAGTFIAYATAPDQVAFDGKGENSPFTCALLQHIETPGLSVGDLMIDVRNKVLAETNNRQEPWDQSSLRARFYFVPPEPEPNEAPQVVSEAASEWAAIQGTTSLAVLATFQERHSDPPWSTYAEARANELRAADAARQAVEDAEREETERRRKEQAERDAAASARPANTRPVSNGPAKLEGGRKTNWPLILGGITVVAVAVVTIGGALIFTRPWETQSVPTRPTATAPQVPKPEHVAAIEQPRPTTSCAGIRTNVAGKGVACLDPSDPAKREFRDCSGGFCGPTMVALPTGSYKRGSPDTEVGRDSDEGPVQEVTIGYHFAVGKFEVTFDEWDACVADAGCKHSPSDSGFGRGKRPVIIVSWNDITGEYLPWLNRRLGLSGSSAYRLLTEAEWEYAARAGTTAPFSFGETISTEQANYNGKDIDGKGKGTYRGKTIEVGSLNAPNAFGLHDMHGNVWEWIADNWRDNYLGAPTDGSVWSGGDKLRRVVRGGSWYGYPQSLRSANRFRDQPGDRSLDIGFRVARTLEP
ncbi:MAG: SUMF1/EgtB/PvdO family nonheme iron enzyme [Pseudomonadota bacterium]